MDLLKFEFTDDPADAYNMLIGDLVKKIRHYRTEVSIDQFKAAMPILQGIERNIQRIDMAGGGIKRNYLQEIMTEMDVEDSVVENLKEEMTRALKAILADILEIDFSVAELNYVIGKTHNFFWMLFSGYKDDPTQDTKLKIVKEILRSICSRYQVIFIDNAG